MEEGVEARRVVKLGQSSLVVSLPKRWADRVGLKAGDIVLVISEGENLRLRPVRRREELEIKVRGKEAALVSYVVPCAYVLGYERAVFEAGVPLDDLRKAVERLPGAVMNFREEGGVEVKIAVDLDKLSVKELLRKNSSLSSQIALLLSRALEGSAEQEELESLKSQSYSLRSLGKRFLYAKLSEGKRSISFFAITLISLGWLVDSIMLELAEHAMREGVRNRNLAETAMRISELPLLASSLPPSLRKSLELMEKATSIEGELRGERDPIAARLLDVVKVFKIMGASAVCVSMAEGGGD
ncbi:MAG: AbrB/MazE/SpoVT family DNA-binding domain-containing protein [Acidilobaceae archaeon]|nr:AbrB/MazE/SpoVT family DNA-binding domain-containing protein [Acidilobaceae archaeon]